MSAHLFFFQFYPASRSTIRSVRLPIVLVFDSFGLRRRENEIACSPHHCMFFFQVFLIMCTKTHSNDGRKEVRAAWTAVVGVVSMGVMPVRGTPLLADRS